MCHELYVSQSNHDVRMVFHHKWTVYDNVNLAIMTMMQNLLTWFTDDERSVLDLLIPMGMSLKTLLAGGWSKSAIVVETNVPFFAIKFFLFVIVRGRPNWLQFSCYMRYTYSNTFCFRRCRPQSNLAPPSYFPTRRSPFLVCGLSLTIPVTLLNFPAISNLFSLYDTGNVDIIVTLLFVYSKVATEYYLPNSRYSVARQNIIISIRLKQPNIISIHIRLLQPNIISIHIRLLQPNIISIHIRLLQPNIISIHIRLLQPNIISIHIRLLQPNIINIRIQ